MTIIVDSDGLIGVSNSEDAHHAISIRVLEKLDQADSTLIYPATTIAEATAILQIRLNKKDIAERIIESVKVGIFSIEPIDQKIIISASRYLKQKESKHNTLFDGIVAAVAEKYKADAIFSFDKFYKTKGFKLASELP